MGVWLFTLDVREIKEQVRNGFIDPETYAKKMADAIEDQLGKLANNDSELEQIIFDFRYNIDEYSTWDYVDEILENLYDWADYNRCWVKSF